jgi:hypothetical protein
VGRKRETTLKKFKKKRQKGEKELQKIEASTGPSVGECEHPREGTPKIGADKKGEKGNPFGPRRVLNGVGEKERKGSDVEPMAVGSL